MDLICQNCLLDKISQVVTNQSSHHGKTMAELMATMGNDANSDT